MKFDITIVGSGITGLSAAFHLAEGGGVNVALVAAHTSAGPCGDSVSERSAGAVSATMTDNFTRVSHAHGLTFAKELWGYSERAFDDLLTFCNTYEVATASQRRLRFLVSDSELREATAAVHQLKNQAGAPTLMRPEDKDWPTLLSTRVIAVQDDGPKGAWVDVNQLLSCLRAQIADKVSLISAKVMSVTSGRSGIELVLEDGQKLNSEMVILATHLETGTLWPAIAPALVAVADQWHEFVSLASPNPFAKRQGLCFSTNHGYEWGVVRPTGVIEFGGARFLRSMAGIGAEKALVEPNIASFLGRQINDTFTDARLTIPNGRAGQAGLDCRPCDELPIIGPMFGEERVLVATGFMGSGLSLGFKAGKCLSQIIESGRSFDLPDRLLPRRLRTMEA